jgi:azurin
MKQLLLTLCAAVLTSGLANAKVVELGTLHGQLKFDKETIQVNPGEQITIRFKNTDEMAHNVVICKIGTDTNKLGLAAIAMGEKGLAAGYIPESDKILFHTPLVEPAESYELTFKAPSKKGAYPYVCTFPGHHTVMIGTLYVGQAPAYGLSNVRYRLYKGTWTNLPDFSKLEVKGEGQLPKKRMTVKLKGAGNSNWAAIYDATLTVPKTGKYQLNAGSDDGCAILIDGKEVWKHDGVHPVVMKRVNVDLKAGAHTVEVRFFQGGGGQELKIGLSGNGLKKNVTQWTEQSPGGGGGGGGDYVLKAEKTPRIYRTGLSVPGLSKGAYSIAVGMPGDISYAFDAQTCVLRAAWTGGYIDVKSDWSGRGGNGSKALGNVFYKTDALPFAIDGLADSSAKYRGYRLVDGYPVFLYTLGGSVKVEHAVKPGANGGIAQSFKVSNAPGAVTYKHSGGGTASSDAGAFANGSLTLKKQSTITFNVEVAGQ